MVALVIGIPLFLRTPPWCDITLYQMAARNILNGGTHYRDIFDTNLPGFVWVLTVLQWLFGESVVAVRATDLLIVSGTVFLIDRLAKWGGASLAARWWALAGVALFYPFTVEMSHAQRDTWMTLPALAAVALRVRRGMGRPTPPSLLPEGKGETEPSDVVSSTAPARACTPFPSGRGDGGEVLHGSPLLPFERRFLKACCGGRAFGSSRTS